MSVPPLGDDVFGGLICHFASTGDGICGAAAAFHFHWGGGENSLACELHASVTVKEYDYAGAHAVAGACGVPGRRWMPGPPSYCRLPGDARVRTEKTDIPVEVAWLAATEGAVSANAGGAS